MTILIIQLKQLGDVLMTTPLIKAVKKSHPDAIIHFLVNRGSARVLEANPMVDNVIRYDEKPFIALVRGLRETRYDSVIDCMGLPKTAVLSFLTGAGMRIGFRKRGRTLFYTNPVSLSPEPVYSAIEKGLLLKPLGITLQDPMPELYTLPADAEEALVLASRLNLKDQGKVIAFSPVSRRDYKMWPLSRYAEACDVLFEKYRMKYLPLFGPGEEKTIAGVMALSKHPEAFLFPYAPPSFRALKVLVRECILYFGNDNGIRHIAIAAGLPTAAVFSRINPVVWTPPSPALHRSVWGKEGIETITVRSVIEMVEQVIHEIRSV